MTDTITTQTKIDKSLINAGDYIEAEFHEAIATYEDGLADWEYELLGSNQPRVPATFKGETHKISGKVRLEGRGPYRLIGAYALHSDRLVVTKHKPVLGVGPEGWKDAQVIEAQGREASVRCRFVKNPESSDYPWIDDRNGGWWAHNEVGAIKIITPAAEPEPEVDLTKINVGDTVTIRIDEDTELTGIVKQGLNGMLKAVALDGHIAYFRKGTGEPWGGRVVLSHTPAAPVLVEMDLGYEARIIDLEARLEKQDSEVQRLTEDLSLAERNKDYWFNRVGAAERAELRSTKRAEDAERKLTKLIEESRQEAIVWPHSTEFGSGYVAGMRNVIQRAEYLAGASL